MLARGPVGGRGYFVVRIEKTWKLTKLSVKIAQAADLKSTNAECLETSENL